MLRIAVATTDIGADCPPTASSGEVGREGAGQPGDRAIASGRTHQSHPWTRGRRAVAAGCTSSGNLDWALQPPASRSLRSSASRQHSGWELQTDSGCGAYSTYCTPYINNNNNNENSSRNDSTSTLVSSRRRCSDCCLPATTTSHSLPPPRPQPSCPQTQQIHYLAALLLGRTDGQTDTVRACVILST